VDVDRLGACEGIEEVDRVVAPVAEGWATTEFETRHSGETTFSASFETSIAVPYHVSGDLVRMLPSDLILVPARDGSFAGRAQLHFLRADASVESFDVQVLIDATGEVRRELSAPVMFSSVYGPMLLARPHTRLEIVGAGPSLELGSTPLPYA
jgi:hypothetical protein